MRVALLIGALFITFISIIWHHSIRSEEVVIKEALGHATRLVNYTRIVRQYYSDFVVKRVQANSDLKITARYHDLPHAIPMPTTLILETGEQLNALKEGAQIRIYSRYPFANRIPHTPDEFESAALDLLEASPKSPFVRLESMEGERTVRVAIADVMQGACVECHNTHPESLRRDWKMGDVRGVIEVLLPVEERLQTLASNNHLLSLAYFLVIVILVGALGMMWIAQRRYAAERLEHERMMLHQSRLAVMGETVGHIAHQWRQPLNALSLLLRTLELKSSANKLTSELLATQVQHGMALTASMSQTIDDFRRFYTPEFEKESYVLQERIRYTLGLLHPQFEHHGIKVTTECSSQSTLLGYPNETAQMLLNLMINAMEAMATSPNKELRILVNEDEHHIYLSIEDSGGGIELSVRERLFEPYFTTKSNLNGTGLGLYIVYQILKRVEGEIEVENHEKNGFKGARFRITLPKE